MVTIEIALQTEDLGTGRNSRGTPKSCPCKVNTLLVSSSYLFSFTACFILCLDIIGTTHLPPFWVILPCGEYNKRLSRDCGWLEPHSTVYSSDSERPGVPFLYAGCTWVWVLLAEPPRQATSPGRARLAAQRGWRWEMHWAQWFSAARLSG